MTSTEPSTPKEPEKEKADTKTYLNLYLFKISIGVIFTYIYILASILLTIVNRFLYTKYNFKFNFTLMFIQQFFCFLFFTFIATKNKNFKEKVGEVSFKDFLKLKYQYVFFCFIFSCNYLSSFLGNQLVINTAMYLILRKFLFIMNYLYDLFINGKKLPSYFSISVFFITIGSIFTGFDDLTADLIGYLVVFANNSLSVLYGQLSEQFSKKNGIPNIKLLIYNSYLVTPSLFVIILISGEARRLKEYFAQDHSSMWLWGFASVLLLSSLLCVVLNSSYLMSNEKNSSLFTQLLSQCKDICISGISWALLKNFKITIKTVLGLVFSTIGAIVFSFKSIKENIQLGTSKDTNEDTKKTN